jgi:heme A synthase
VNSRIVVAGVFIQGIIGYLQYFNHLPAGLVWVHVSSAVVLWIFVLRLYLSTRVRVPVTAPAEPDSELAPASLRGLKGEVVSSYDGK